CCPALRCHRALPSLPTRRSSDLSRRPSCAAERRAGPRALCLPRTSPRGLALEWGGNPPSDGGRVGRREMAGHSKWATTKHKKAVIDARRGKLFATLVENIEVGGRMGGPGPA